MWSKTLNALKNGHMPLLWRLTWINVLVFAVIVLLTGIAIYHFACSLAEQIDSTGSAKQTMFNEPLFNYFLVVSLTAILIGAVIHHYLTKKVVQPIQQLVTSTKVLKLGRYPDPLPIETNNEIGQLTDHFNQLIAHLKQLEESRFQMITDMAHELRTPLTTINGYLEGLSRGVITGDPRLYNALYQEVNRVIDLVDQLYRLTEWSIEQEPFLQKAPLEISSLVKDCLRLYRLELNQRKIKVILDLEPGTILGNAHGLQQVVANLIDNAIQYKNGDDPIHIKGRKREDDYMITVTARGLWIPPDQKERIFDRFYRVDPSRSRNTGGAGLGLAIAKDIIRRHSGEIELETDGYLHTFWFTLSLDSSAEPK